MIASLLQIDYWVFVIVASTKQPVFAQRRMNRSKSQNDVAYTQEHENLVKYISTSEYEPQTSYSHSAIRSIRSRYDMSSPSNIRAIHWPISNLEWFNFYYSVIHLQLFLFFYSCRWLVFVYKSKTLSTELIVCLYCFYYTITVSLCFWLSA